MNFVSFKNLLPTLAILMVMTLGSCEKQEITPKADENNAISAWKTYDFQKDEDHPDDYEWMDIESVPDLDITDPDLDEDGSK